LISVVCFYFDGIKAKKKAASVQAKLLIGRGKQKNTFWQKLMMEKLNWLTIPHKERRKNSQNIQEGYKINKPLFG